MQRIGMKIKYTLLIINHFITEAFSETDGAFRRPALPTLEPERSFGTLFPSVSGNSGSQKQEPPGAAGSLWPGVSLLGHPSGRGGYPPVISM